MVRELSNCFKYTSICIFILAKTLNCSLPKTAHLGGEGNPTDSCFLLLGKIEKEI